MVRGTWADEARAINDHVYGALVSSPGVVHGEFYCECGDSSCGRLVLLMLEDYAAMRARGGEVAVSPEQLAPLR
jgi:hypothetical protein